MHALSAKDTVKDKREGGMAGTSTRAAGPHVPAAAGWCQQRALLHGTPGCTSIAGAPSLHVHVRQRAAGVVHVEQADEGEPHHHGHRQQPRENCQVWREGSGPQRVGKLVHKSIVEAAPGSRDDSKMDGSNSGSSTLAATRQCAHDRPSHDRQAALCSANPGENAPNLLSIARQESIVLTAEQLDE